MRLPILLFALLAGLAGCGSGETITMTIANAWIRLPAVAGRPAAGYVSLYASPDHGALVGVTSPRAGRIEMHEAVKDGAAVRMKRVERISLDDAREIVFAPGGRHLMLFDVDPRLELGARAELVFHFEKGAPGRINAWIVGAGDPAPTFTTVSEPPSPPPPCKEGMVRKGDKVTITNCGG